MKTAGEIVSDCLQICIRENDPVFEKMVWKRLNSIYFSLCRQHPWQALRDSATIDFNGSDDTGMWLPSNLCDIERVRESNDRYDFYRRDKADVEPDESGYRFYTYVPDSTDMFYAEDCTVSNGATSFSCSSLGANDYTGYYVRFGTGLGVYKLTAATSFTPAYYGEDLTDDEIRIRPAGTQKMVLIDAGETILKSCSAVVYYWKMPTPLSRQSDIPVITLPEILELSLYRSLPEAKNRRPVSEGEVEKALQRALALNPDFPRKVEPRDAHNRIFSMKTSIFGRR